MINPLPCICCHGRKCPACNQEGTFDAYKRFGGRISKRDYKNMMLVSSKSARNCDHGGVERVWKTDDGIILKEETGYFFHYWYIFVDNDWSQLKRLKFARWVFNKESK